MITKIIENVLPQIAKEKTEKELGNREEYIGASDVAQCPRKVVLGKQNPVEHNLETLIMFQRGHLAEELLKTIFDKTYYQYTAQMELTHPELPYLKAHLDFVFYTKDMSKIGVLELKTVSNIPDEPYDSWVQQLFLQMGLLKLKYPDAEIRGSVLAIDLNSGKMQEFNSFEHDSYIFNLLVKKAEKIKKALDGELAPETEEGFLCTYCAYKCDCPALSRGERYNVPSDVSAKVEKLIQLLESEKEIKNLKEEIKEYMKQTEVNTMYVNASVVQYQSRKGRKTLDEKALKDAHPELDLTPFYKEGSPYSFITIK